VSKNEITVTGGSQTQGMRTGRVREWTKNKGRRTKDTWGVDGGRDRGAARLGAAGLGVVRTGGVREKDKRRKTNP
jgi:hypothetical protein